MYRPLLLEVTTKEDWDFTVLLIDVDTFLPIDLSDAEITVSIGLQGCAPVLVASVANGKVDNLSEEGKTFRAVFRRNETGTPRPDTYEMGCLVDRSGAVQQLFVASLQVVSGQ